MPQTPSEQDPVVFTEIQTPPMDGIPVDLDSTFYSTDPLPAYPRRLLFCPYASFNRKGDGSPADGNWPDLTVTPETPYFGNCVLASRFYYGKLHTLGAPSTLLMDVTGIDPAGLDHGGEPFLAEYDPAWLNPTLAYFIHGAGSAIQRHEDNYRRAASLPAKPIAFYLDARDGWPARMPGWMDPNRTWIAFQAYRQIGETVTEFRDAVFDVIERLKTWRCPLILTLQAYDLSGAMKTQDVVDIYPVYDAIVRGHKEIMGVMPFADQRPGGMASHIEIWWQVKRMWDATMGRPNRFDHWVPDDIYGAIDQLMQYDQPSPHPTIRDIIRRLAAAEQARLAAL